MIEQLPSFLDSFCFEAEADDAEADDDDDDDAGADEFIEFSFLRRAIIAATRSLRRALNACRGFGVSVCVRERRRGVCEREREGGECVLV